MTKELPAKAQQGLYAQLYRRSLPYVPFALLLRRERSLPPPEDGKIIFRSSLMFCSDQDIPMKSSDKVDPRTGVFTRTHRSGEVEDTLLECGPNHFAIARLKSGDTVETEMPNLTLQLLQGVLRKVKPAVKAKAEPKKNKKKADPVETARSRRSRARSCSHRRVRSRASSCSHRGVKRRQ